LAPEELPGYSTLKSCRVVEYVPEWKRREDEKKAYADKTLPQPPPPASVPEEKRQKEINPAEDLEYSIEDTPTADAGGFGQLGITAVRGDNDPDEDMDSPPR